MKEGNDKGGINQCERNWYVRNRGNESAPSTQCPRSTHLEEDGADHRLHEGGEQGGGGEGRVGERRVLIGPHDAPVAGLHVLDEAHNLHMT